MQRGSLVICNTILELDEESIPDSIEFPNGLPKLKEICTVADIDHERGFIYLEEYPIVVKPEYKYALDEPAFLIQFFEEIQKPMTIDINQLINS